MSNAIMAPEDREQQTVFEWAAIMEHKYPELQLLFAIANGGFRHKATAARLKITGVKSGVPDICLPVARGRYHGLYIELKTIKGKPSENQLKWIGWLKATGHVAEVCYGNQAATDMIEWYLNLK